MPVKGYTPVQRDLLFYGVDSPAFHQHFPQTEPPATVMRGRFEGVANTILRRYGERIADADYRQKMATYVMTQLGLPGLLRQPSAC